MKKEIQNFMKYGLYKGISIDTDFGPPVVVKVETFLILFRLALAILCYETL